MMNKTLETDRLLLLPLDNDRDNQTFMTMLRVDGISRDFAGVDFMGDNPLKLGEYFDCPESCYYTIIPQG